MQSYIITNEEFLKNKSLLNYPIIDKEQKLISFSTHLKNYKQELQKANTKQEHEEHYKNLFNDLLKNIYSYNINTHKRIDCVIKDSQDSIKTIIEVKRPSNTNEMIQEDNFNNKALHEALLYYYEQRKQNISSINYIIITDCQDLYLFSSSEFEKLTNNKQISQLLSGYRDKSLEIIKTTANFYDEVSKLLESEDITLTATKMNSCDDNLDSEIIYRLLDEYNLFNKIVDNDANQLNREFYNELLYIMGLQETIDNKLIPNNTKNTLLDLTTELIKSQYKKEDQFETALGLNILWLNRILFLKILESQLKVFRNDKEFSILDPIKITGYHLLAKLFFRILSTPRDQRHEDDKEYDVIPYLNSSLFEETKLERNFRINDLDIERQVNIMPSSILYKNKNFKDKKLTLLDYLLKFLNCFHFNSDSVNEDNNTVIKSSVLGLVFEKLNGYKDGSHFTPASITMYMSNKVIQKRVLTKFNDAFNINCDKFEELLSYAQNNFHKTEVQTKAHNVIDSISIIDPAVGSGHFLVSSLNELIQIKSELGLLHKDIKVQIQNDELLITSRFGDGFVYQMMNGAITDEKREIQQAIFQTKKHIIENQLYGVDINPNSVNICRLRLWIELLKHTYYTDKEYRNLEVLPNLEFKIMTANSLISLKEDNLFFGAEQKTLLRQKMKEYYNAVNIEKHNIKQEVIELIEKYKNDVANIQLEKYEPFDTLQSNQFFDSGLMFGVDHFDICIMNPPYFALQSIAKKNNSYQKENFDTYKSTGDIYQLFLERAFDLIYDKGIVSAIVSNKWMRAGYGQSTRHWLYSKAWVHEVLDLGANWFASATVDTNIITYEKRNDNPYQTKISAYTMNNKVASITEGKIEQKQISLNEKGDSWIILNEAESAILEKMNKVGKPLKDWDISINYGIKTGFNEAFIIDTDTKDRLIQEDSHSAEIIKPLLRGRDIKRYSYEFADKWLINTHNGVKSKNIAPIDINNYPAIKKHLNQYSKQITKRQDQGDTPYNLRNCAYYEDFDKPKIAWASVGANEYSWIPKDWFLLDTNYFMTCKSIIMQKYIIGIINSWIFIYGLEFKDTRLGDGGAWRHYKYNIEEMKIPVPTDAQEKEIVALVDTILSNKAQQLDTSHEESQIDTLVYHMYGLTKTEIEIIEGR